MKPSFPLLSILFCLLLFWVVACKKSTDSVTPKSSEKTISAFAFAGLNPPVTATVDATAKTITATVPYGTDVTKLVPTITVSAKATVSPASGVAQNFMKAVPYTVTAEDGSTQIYTVAVGVGTAPKSPAKDIKTFTFAALSPAVSCTIDATAKTITATLPAGTDLTRLVPTITISDKATVSPASGVAQNFTKAVPYTVTAEDGSTQVYTATMSLAVVQSSSNGLVYIGNLDGTFFALDALTGAKKWTFQAGDAIQSTPAVASGMVYIASTDKKLYALDAATGTKKWEFVHGFDNAFAAPMVANGIVYFGGDPNLYALDALTGAKKWEFLGDDELIFESSPTVVNGVVYVSLRGIGGSKQGLGTFALDAKTGAKVWSSPTQMELTESSPAVVNGVVYAGSELAGLGAFDAATGAQKWTFEAGNCVTSAPTVANGIVYIGGSDSKLYAVDAKTGAQKWAYQTEDESVNYSSPIVANGIVYVGSGSTLYAIDATTGSKKWTASPEENTIINSGPVVANGLVYIGINEKMYAFDANTGAKKWEYTMDRAIDQASPCVLDKNGTAYHAGISGMVQ